MGSRTGPGNDWPDRRTGTGRGSGRFSTTSLGQGLDGSHTWTRKSHTSLMGLCNRASLVSLDSMLPKIIDAVKSVEDAQKCVETIFACLGRSDSYVKMYVQILDGTRGVEGMDDAITEYSHAFLARSPYILACAPDATMDYNGFCRAVKEKRFLANVTEAVAMLGHGDEVASRALLALDVVRDPSNSAQKDLAISYLKISSAYGGSDQCAFSIADLDKILQHPLIHNLDARCRFALMDLCTFMHIARAR